MGRFAASLGPCGRASMPGRGDAAPRRARMPGATGPTDAERAESGASGSRGTTAPRRIPCEAHEPENLTLAAPRRIPCEAHNPDNLTLAAPRRVNAGSATSRVANVSLAGPTGASEQLTGGYRCARTW